MTRKLLYASILLLFVIVAGLLIGSHFTYYKYNDWWIVGKNKKDIIAFYGDFDVKLENYGGYYIYDNKDTALPSQHPVYYWIEFDNDGDAVSVCADE